jgi:hypothetical protein
VNAYYVLDVQIALGEYKDGLAIIPVLRRLLAHHDDLRNGHRMPWNTTEGYLVWSQVGAGCRQERF